MKDLLKSLLKLILGFIIGVIAIFLFTENKNIIYFWQNIAGIPRPDIFSIRFFGIMPLAVYLLISVLVVLVITYLIRFFANSKNVKKRAAILNIIVQLFIGIPLTTMIYAFLDPLLQLTRFEVVLLIALSALLYAIIFMGTCMIFERAFYEKLKKGHKRCKLVICNVVSSTSYEEGEVLVQKMTYDDCYTAMKNNGERLTVRQFFKIIELNWSGKKEVDSWRYYKTGDFIRDTDEVLCQSLMRVVEAQNIDWQG